MDLLNIIWHSQWLGVFLWTLLVALLFAPMAAEWWQRRKQFDVFEPKNIFRGVFFLYYGIPSFYYLIHPRRFPYVYDFDAALKITLIFAIIATTSFYIGYRIPIRWVPKLPEGEWSGRRLLLIVAGATLISAASFSLLMKRVGGACYYFTHLGQTNELMVGNTYFLWGILLLKTSSLLLLAKILGSRKFVWWQWIIAGLYISLSLLLVSFLGSRILAVLYVFEVLIVVNYLRRKIHIALLAGILAIVIVVIVGILGEFRNFSWAAPQLCTANQEEQSLEYRRTHRQSAYDAAESAMPHKGKTPTTPDIVSTDEYVSAFTHQLQTLGSNEELLIDRYINNYFDSVRTTMMTYENTPEHLHYQYGLGYLQAVLQPIPGSVRPQITVPNDGPNIFSEAPGYSRIQSLLAESYMNFGWLGVAFVPFILGIFAKFLLELRATQQKNRWAVLFYAVGIGGLMVYIRGYFTGHTALFLMDVVPLLLALGILHFGRRSSQ